MCLSAIKDWPERSFWSQLLLLQANHPREDNRGSCATGGAVKGAELKNILVHNESVSFGTKMFAAVPWKLLWQPPLAVPPHGVGGCHRTSGITKRSLGECAPHCPVCSFLVGDPRGGSSQAAVNSSVWSVGRADSLLLSHYSVTGRGNDACSDSWAFLPFLIVLRTTQLLSHGHKSRRIMRVWPWSLCDRFQLCFSLKKKKKKVEKEL